MEFLDLDNILCLLHKQPRMSLRNIDGREENQSTNHLYPSSNLKVGRKFLLVTYYFPIEQFVYRKKSISLANAIDVLTKLREEILGVEYDGIVKEIPIPLQL